MVAATIVTSESIGYSTELAAAYEREPTPFLMQNLWFLLGIIMPLGITGIVGLIGLYKFKSWGRTLSLYSTIIGLVIYPFCGPTLSSGLGSAFLEMSNLLWGAVLTLSYFSSINDRFSANNRLQRMHAEP